MRCFEVKRVSTTFIDIKYAALLCFLMNQDEFDFFKNLVFKSGLFSNMK